MYDNEHPYEVTEEDKMRTASWLTACGLTYTWNDHDKFYEVGPGTIKNPPIVEGCEYERGSEEGLSPIVFDADQWFSGVRIRDFSNMFNRTSKDVEMFLSDIADDLGLIVAADEARSKGSRCFYADKLYDADCVLSTNRLSDLANAVREGAAAYLSGLSGKALPEGMNMDSLKAFKFGDVSSKEYAAYKAILNAVK